MYLTSTNLIAVVLAGGFTGVLGAVLGTGGGVFLIPILVLGLGVPMHHAVATSILSVIATSSAVAGSNVERGTANMRLGMTLEIATALGAIVGGLTAGWLAPRTLEGVFALALLPTAVLMWRGRTEHGDEAETGGEGGSHSPAGGPGPATEFDVDGSLGVLGGRYFDETEGGLIAYRVQRLGAGLGVSFLAGNLSGLLGIGGGVFKVPALHLLCGVPIRAAAATSNFMIGVTAAASACALLRARRGPTGADGRRGPRRARRIGRRNGPEPLGPGRRRPQALRRAAGRRRRSDAPSGRLGRGVSVGGSPGLAPTGTMGSPDPAVGPYRERAAAHHRADVGPPGGPSPPRRSAAFRRLLGQRGVRG